MLAPDASVKRKWMLVIKSFDLKRPKPSPKFYSCHQHILSPTSVTNIDVTICLKGLNMSSGYSCFDINECDEFDTGQNNICPQYSECINVFASYQCACYDGFVAYNGSCQVY